MKNKTLAFLLFTILGTTPGILQAVAVPPEIIDQEARQASQSVYGLITLVFVIGIVVGFWVQKRLTHADK